ncbi:MAG: ABC-2 family transporter protein [Burkholderiaceae bacterium]
MKRIRETMQYIVLLNGAALRMALSDRRALFALSFFMLLQNLVMFMVWIIYFANFSSLKGWHLEDLATLYGIAAFSFGTAFFLCGGTLDMGRAIVDGELDIYLGRPRHPLPGLMFRESRISGLGDIATAPIVWVVFGHQGPAGVLVLVLLGLLSSLIILATALAINCLPFFSSQSSRLSDQLLESFIIISTYPHNGFPVIIKILLLTLVPAGFVAFLPVEAFRTLDPLEIAALAGAALIYLLLAITVFNLGMKRYASGNRMLEVR